MNYLFNNAMEMGIRSLLLLDAFTIPATIDRMAILDLFTVYGKDFKISDFNLHGDASFSFSELDARRQSFFKGIKAFVLKGFIEVHFSEYGFRYSISDSGRVFLHLNHSQYIDEYKNCLEKALVILGDKTDIELEKEFNQMALSTIDNNRKRFRNIYE